MRKFLIISLSILFLSFDLVEYSAYQKDDLPNRIKAQHLYIFTKDFNWPDNANPDFTIAILGNNPALIAELSKVTNNKTVGTKKITVKNVNAVSEIAKPEILYILSEKSSSLTEASSKYKAGGTLIVTEKDGLAKAGATINFTIIESKIRFELNKSTASKAKLKFSAKIEPMAAKIFD